MDTPTKVMLPPPRFGPPQKDTAKSRPYYLTPSGMTLLPREKQPPPMYGPRGATVPPKFLPQHHRSVNKLPPPKPTEPKFCEACEVELQSEEDYRLHCKQHIRCPVEGCNYRGLSSVMDKHVDALHSSGLFDKFKKLSTPEEINAWREERRKRYPTVSNVQMRQKVKEQRQKRGERLNPSQNRFGKREDRRQMQKGAGAQGEESHCERVDKRQNNKKKSKDKHWQKKNPKETKEVKNAKPKEVAKNDALNVVPKRELELLTDEFERFKGTSKMQDYKRIKFEKPKNTLTNLLSMYGSNSEASSEDDDYDCENKDEMLCNDQVIECRTEGQTDINRCAEEVPSQFCKGSKSEEVQISIATESGVKDKYQKCETLAEVQSNVRGDTEESTGQLTNESKLEEVVAANAVEEVRAPEDDHENSNGQNNNRNEDSNEADKTLVNIYNQAVVKSTNEPDCAHSSDDEMPEEKPIERISNLPIVDKSCQEPPEKRSKVEPEPTTQRHLQRDKNRRILENHKRLRRQNTLLEKLLQADIRHERNVMLQCIRYICENNFFGIGEKK